MTLAGVAALALTGIGVRSKLNQAVPSKAYVPRQPGTLTFNKEIAPIVFDNCSGCHRPGQAAPFNLLSYEDVQKHARDIVEVTARRYMPPWLPEPGYNMFIGERSLTDEQIGLIEQWVSEGTKEGAR